MPTQYVTGAYGGIVLGTGDFASPFTVGAPADISANSGSGISAGVGYAASVTNYGYIYGATNAIGLPGGGVVVNTELGGIRSGAHGQLYGAIYGEVNGVSLGAGGTVTNNLGVIKGIGGVGILITGAAGAVYNSGTVRGDINGARNVGVGVSLMVGGTVTNSATGVIGGSDGGVIVAGGAGNFVANFGRIQGSLYGVNLQYGTVTNAAGGEIYADQIGVSLQQGTLLNNGVISVDYSGEFRPASPAGVFLVGGGYVYNGVGASIGVDYRVKADGIFAETGMATVKNEGTVSAYDAVVLADGGTVLNAASIIGTGQYGVFINLTRAANADHPGSVLGYISNASTATITGYVAVRSQGVGSLGADLSRPTLNIVNAGLIDGSGTGVGLQKTNASLTNAAGGTIEGAGASGIYLDNSDGMISNAAGALISGSAGAGVYARLSDLTLINSGIIVDASGGRAGVRVAGNYYNGQSYDVVAYITNNAGGTISGVDGVYLDAAAGSVRNAGTIIGTGGTAVYLNGGINEVIVDAGASFSGIVEVKTDDGTLELTSGASAGTIHGLGSQYVGFGTVTIDSGASWTVAGTIAGFATPTIVGFGATDRLDLTDVTFASGDSVSLSGSDLLTVENVGGTVLGTIQLAGDFSGDFFHLTDDGNHGSYVTEDGTPCYCRGTLILTDTGEVPVEHLKIGDRLITKSGAARPIRWIGTRSYSGRFAEGNRDVLPVLMKAGALADNVPRRDLWVSPLHAIYLDGVLVPAVHLVNGTSIVQASTCGMVEYFHLELDTHDVIIAEGAAAESFLDDDSRGMFHNAPDYTRLYPDAVRKEPEYCAPMVEDGGELEVIRRRIAARDADEKMGWAA